LKEAEFASKLDSPDGRGVIAAVEVGIGVAVAVAAALVERPKLCRVGLEAVKLAAKLLNNIEALLFGPIGVVALLDDPCGNPTSPKPSKAIVGFK
jgi:hypothetical protein